MGRRGGEPANDSDGGLTRGQPALPPPKPPDFEALHARTFGHVWGILGRAGITRTAERHEVAQEVYLVVHLKLATRNLAAPELAWVGTIAWQYAKRYLALERTQKEQPMDEPDLQEEAVATGPSPEEIVGRRRRYHDIVGGLIFERRVVFEMHDVEGFTLPDIASALGITLGTATTRLRLAREYITAAASRLEAREAHAEGREASPLLVPFGLGGWAHVGRLFDDAPTGAQEHAWRGVRRALARATTLGSGAAAGAVAVGKTTAGALLGAAFVLGGAAVGGALYAFGFLGVERESSPAITRVPEVVSIASSALAPASVTPVEVRASASSAPKLSAPSASFATAATASAASPPSTIDPEEERIMAQAHAAYARGNYEATRAALDEHDRRFQGDRAKLAAESEHLHEKLVAVVDAGVSWPPGAPDAGRNPHRLLGSDD
jgi:RNA polymerase sigma-70 factor, ECF subfamily